MEERIFGIDYGKRRIGIAIASSSKFLATPLATIERTPSLKKTAKALHAFCSKDYGVESYVLGLPLTLKGEDSEMTKEVREFLIHLKDISKVDVILFDERLTSVQADRELKTLSQSRKKRKENTDNVAACLLLQAYLDQL